MTTILDPRRMGADAQPLWKKIMRNTHPNRIESVRTLEGMVLEARYTGGQRVQVDLSGLADSLAVFAPLTQREVFERAAVTDWGHSVSWSDDASLDADRLMEMALEQSGRADTLGFRHWLEPRQGIAYHRGMRKRQGLDSVRRLRHGKRPGETR